MADVNRIRVDLRADPQSVKDFAVDSATGIEIGDLVWLDTDDVKNAGHANLWSQDEPTTQNRLGRWFVGVALSAHKANDPAGTVRVAGRGIAEYPLNAATTLEIGDLIGGSKASGNALEDQIVEKLTGAVASTHYAIGRVAKRGTSLATATFQFVGRAEIGAIGEPATLTGL